LRIFFALANRTLLVRRNRGGRPVRGGYWGAVLAALAKKGGGIYGFMGFVDYLCKRRMYF
jgi:hypothetical protein